MAITIKVKGLPPREHMHTDNTVPISHHKSLFLTVPQKCINAKGFGGKLSDLRLKSAVCNI